MSSIDQLPIKGFDNTGAICWMNSLLQAILACIRFRNVVIACPNTGSATLVILKLLCRDYATAAINGQPTYSLYSAKLLEALAMDLRDRQPKNYRILCDGNQQSASEGFVLLLSALRSLEVNQLFFHLTMNKIYDKTTGKELSSQKAMMNFFTVFDEQRLINEGLETYIMKEQDMITNEDGIQCIKRSTLHYSPEIIVILLNRYVSRNGSIRLPDTFRIPYKEKGKYMSYKRKSDILHTGSLHGGHYIARVAWGIGNQCYLCNDNIVRQVPNIETTTATYMTFYEYQGLN